MAGTTAATTVTPITVTAVDHFVTRSAVALFIRRIDQPLADWYGDGFLFRLAGLG
jgi:hypothetical protein